MSTEYVIYCDESEDKGRFFSNFFGGVLVRSQHLEEVQQSLAECKDRLGLGAHECKWRKTCDHLFSPIKKSRIRFFGLVAEDKVKVRIMFRQNAVVPEILAYIRGKRKSASNT